VTVGIAASYDDGGDEEVVLVADRMVTTGAVEHEHSDGKLEEISPGRPAVAAVASGTLAHADELYYRVGDRLLDESPDTVQAVAEMFVEEMQEVVREEANNRVLQGYGLTLQDLTKDGTKLADELVAGLLESVQELKSDIEQNTTMLITGVDDRHGAQILELRNGSLMRHRSLGYQCIGSGANSAQLTFMRNGYEPDGTDDALLMAADAKHQAAEAQGVGEDMDIAIVSDRVEFLDRDKVDDVQSLIKDVRDAEETAREKTINGRTVDPRG